MDLRRGVLLLFAAVAGGAVGGVIAQTTPPQYMGTARVGLTASLASAAAAEVLSRFRAALVSPEVIQAAVTRMPSVDIDPTDVLGRPTSRMAGDELTVDLIWPDPETAATLAGGVADAIVTDVNQQQARHRHFTAIRLKAELQEAEVVLRVARDALLKFYQSSRLMASLAEMERFTQASNDVARLSADIASRRAGIAALRTRLAQETPAQGDPTLPELMALNEATLAHLGARRDYLASLIGAATNQRLSAELAQLSVLEAELIGAYVRALDRRNSLSDDYRLNQHPRQPGLERRGKATSQRVDRITARSASILGAAAAFVVAMFGVILLGARRRSNE